MTIPAFLRWCFHCSGQCRASNHFNASSSRTADFFDKLSIRFSGQSSSVCSRRYRSSFVPANWASRSLSLSLFPLQNCLINAVYRHTINCQKMLDPKLEGPFWFRYWRTDLIKQWPQSGRHAPLLGASMSCLLARSPLVNDAPSCSKLTFVVKTDYLDHQLKISLFHRWFSFDFFSPSEQPQEVISGSSLLFGHTFKLSSWKTIFLDENSYSAISAAIGHALPGPLSLNGLKFIKMLPVCWAA